MEDAQKKKESSGKKKQEQIVDENGWEVSGKYAPMLQERMLREQQEAEERKKKERAERREKSQQTKLMQGDTYSSLDISEEQKKQLVNNNGLSKDNILVPGVYSEIFFDNYRYFILSSGRVSGKTSILVAIWWITLNKYPDRDIVILQATATEIKESIINEIEKFLTNSGYVVGGADDRGADFVIPATRDRISCKDKQGETRFYPITDSKGGQRSRGINTKNRLSLVLYEEAQKNKDANVLEQSVVTFIRQLDRMAKLVIVGNNETKGHWFVDYVESKKNLPEWKYIYANCYDIWGLLNEQTQNYIEGYKKTNYTEFRRIFLGDIDAVTSDIVFPQFKREQHYKKYFELKEHIINYLIIGIDHATANDTFAIVPVAILDDGSAQTLQVCYDDPKESNVSLAPTEQCEILENFLEWLDNKYGLTYNRVPIVLSIDGAAAPFIKQVEHLKRTSKRRDFWKKVQIRGFTMKKKDTNLGIIKNAFAYGVLIVLNEGQYDWSGAVNKHRLAREIEAQRWKNGKLDPSIPNDLCDALEYGLIPFYSNCYNLSFPSRMMQENAYKSIHSLAYGK